MIDLSSGSPTFELLFTPPELPVGASTAGRNRSLAGRLGWFGVASGLGFLATEAVLTAGVLAVYHGVHVPKADFTSAWVLGLNALAFGTGVTVSFVVNERFTVRGEGGRGSSGAKGALWRLARFQGVSLLGNLGVVAVQLALLAWLEVSPVIGNALGAVALFPVAYLLSMRLVWREVRPGPAVVA